MIENHILYPSELVNIDKAKYMHSFVHSVKAMPGFRMTVERVVMNTMAEIVNVAIQQNENKVHMVGGAEICNQVLPILMNSCDPFDSDKNRSILQAIFLEVQNFFQSKGYKTVLGPLDHKSWSIIISW